jgi:hypothetical protein
VNSFGLIIEKRVVKMVFAIIANNEIANSIGVIQNMDV